MRVVRPSARPFHLAALLLPLALAACGGDSGGGPAAGPPARIELVGTVPATTVATVVTPSPSVRVTDASGTPVPGVDVTFAVGSGGGLSAGGLQVTNTQGIATVGSWRLGTSAGSDNTLVATAGTLSTIISVQATPGPAATAARAANVPQTQNVAPSAAVAIPPAVVVTDQYGNPIQGVPVQFAAAAGSGTITGGVQSTNAQGVATVGSWTVGSTTGTQSLTATAGSLPPVTFFANVGTAGNPCNVTAYVLGATINGSLATTDCDFGDGSFVDLFQATTNAQVNHAFSLTSAAFDTYLWIFSSDGQRVLAASDDVAQGTTNSGLRLLAPPGSYLLAVNSYDAGEVGPYTFSSTNAPEAPGCIYTRWVVPGAVWSESVAATDCAEPSGTGGTAAGDEYGVVLSPGQSLVVTMRSTALDPYLRLINASTGATLAQNNDFGSGTDARVAYTVPASGTVTLVVIVATTNLASQTGAYTLETSSATAAALVAGAPVKPGVVAPWASARAKAQLAEVRAQLRALRGKGAK